MKKIIFKILFIFFISFNVLNSYDYSNLSEDLLLEDISINNINDKYDYLLSDYRETNNEQKLIEYINKAGFYKCKVFEELGSTNVNNLFLDSCTIFSENNDTALALEKLDIDSLDSTENIIYNSFITLLLTNSGNKERAEVNIAKLNNDENLEIFTEFIRFSLGIDYDLNVLLDSTYNYKDIFIYKYISTNGKANTNFTIELAKKILEYENRDFFHEMEGINIVSFYQNVFLLLSNYYDSKEEPYKSLYFLFKFIDEYSDNNDELSYQKSYERILIYMLNGNKFEDLGTSDYNIFLSFLDEDDEKIISLYIYLRKSLNLKDPSLNDILDIASVEEYIDLLYCKETNILIKGKSKLKDVIGLISSNQPYDLNKSSLCEEGKVEMTIYLNNREILDNSNKSNKFTDNLLLIIILSFSVLAGIVGIIKYIEKK